MLFNVPPRRIRKLNPAYGYWASVVTIAPFCASLPERNEKLPYAIELTFATVRLRMAKICGCVSLGATLKPGVELDQSAAKRWRRLCGYKRLGLEQGTMRRH